MICVKNYESLEKEAKQQQAITEYKKQQKNYQKVSIRCVTRDFNVPRQTLQDCLDGKVACNKAYEGDMNLTNKNEMELVYWITILTQCGYALYYCTV